jgi:hypothetical protein
MLVFLVMLHYECIAIYTMFVECRGYEITCKCLRCFLFFLCAICISLKYLLAHMALIANIGVMC